MVLIAAGLFDTSQEPISPLSSIPQEFYLPLAEGSRR
jgi:hypothetical protein